MTPNKRRPSDEEMLGWVVEPDEAPDQDVGEPLSDEEAAELAERVEQARALDRGEPDGIRPAMSREEIAGAGVRIDLPSEAADPDPKDIRYTDGSTLLGRLRLMEKNWKSGKQPDSEEDGGSSSP